MYAITFDAQGKATGRTHYTTNPPADFSSGGLVFVTADPALGEADLDKLEATIESGEVTALDVAAEPDKLWVHATLTGGTTSPSGTLYLKNDGVDALTVSAHLRDGPELATSNPVTQIGGVDIDGLWALELVNVDTKALADTPLVQMTAGVISVSYTTTIAPCEVELAEDRLQPIGPYQLKLAQPVGFKVVRELS